MPKKVLLHKLLIQIIVGLFFLPHLTFAADRNCPKGGMARGVSIEGGVEVLRQNEIDWKMVTLEDQFCPEDQIRTSKESRALLLFPHNDTTLRLNQTSTIQLSSVDSENKTLLTFKAGSGLFFIRSTDRLIIRTPFANSSTQGTELLVEVDAVKETSTFTVLKGELIAENEAGTLPVTSGQSAVVSKATEPPALRLSVNPKDSIKWTLYYPSVIPARSERFAELSDTYWTSQLLSVGRVEEAMLRMEETESRRPMKLTAESRAEDSKMKAGDAARLRTEMSDLLSLQSIVALVQDDKEKAAQLAMAASQGDPASVSAKIALSYAYQADFDLKKGLAVLEEAVQLDPNNTLALSRLAEIQMALGALDKAVDTAKIAVAKNPNEARAETVLGFATLAKMKTEEAKRAFQKAIFLSQADPLPRLGMGLAMIREGNLAEGREQIEIAASLDPEDSLIRSYLGKSYYEENRNLLAEAQLNLAKTLDPNDPTPWLYDALRKQTENRPVEALHDLKKSMERNNNRAVYRSRLLLDEDLATRGTSLSRVYRDLGFEQIALVEGWKSIDIDPASYSAHRLLADSYAALPNSEIARGSSLLVAQLLQPINSTPVQPQLGEKTFLGGAANLSFGEFDRLFIEDGVRLLVSGVTDIGSKNDLLGEELILSGLKGRYSYSLAQLHHKTDGFRENNDQEQTLYNGFFQMALTHKTSIQAEVRSERTETGDVTRNFDPTNFSTTSRRNINAETYRVGFHHTLTPYSDIIASFFYNDRKEAITDTFTVGENSDNRFIGEIQQLFRNNRFNLIVGGEYSNGRETLNLTVDLTSFGIPIETFPPDKSETRHINVYAYSYIHLPSNITMSIGGSGNFFEGLPLDRNQFNPKWGVTWNPIPSTTLRMAGFRVLKKSIISKQTIEPTHVAGFQQFFDDLDSTDSTRYGIAVDQRFSTNLFGGLELSMRHLDVPFINTGTNQAGESSVDEQMNMAYLYFIPYRWVSASAEYQMGRTDTEERTGLFSSPTLKTSRIPLGINLFHSSGLFIKLKETYLDQEGLSNSILSPLDFQFGEDQFWIFNATIGYRFPKRNGIFTIEAKNLGNKAFKFQETLLVNNDSIPPNRIISAKLTLSF